jgi:hypothetical protein
MRLVDEVMRPFIDLFVDVYLDDILIHIETCEDRVSDFPRELELLKANKLWWIMKNCDFAKHILSYMGCMVGGDYKEIDPTKL